VRGGLLACALFAFVSIASTGVYAQTAAKKAPEPTELPALVVESKKTAKTAPPKKAVNVAPKAAPVPQPAPVKIEKSTPETATGPVQGFVAKQSATGTKTDTPIIETPQSISVVTQDQVETQNPHTVGQALGYTAGVNGTMEGASAGFDDNFQARGFAMARYLDGLRIYDQGASTNQTDTYNLQRIEVLRGPSSVLYGQSSPGGIVNMVSKRPQDTAFGEIGVELGSFSSLRGFADFGGPVDREGKLVYRITTTGFNSDTQFEDTEAQRFSISPAITWRPSNKTTWTVLYNYMNAPSLGYQSTLLAHGTILPDPRGKIPLFRNYSNPDTYENARERNSVTSLFEHKLDNVWTVRQNFRYSHAKTDFNTNFTYGLFIERHYTYDNYTADTQIEAKFATGALKHTVLAGYDLLRASYGGLHNETYGDVPDYFNRRDYRPGIPPYGPSYYNSFDAQQDGVYLQDQIAIGNWRFVLGGRNDWASTFADEGDQRNTAFSGRIGAVYLFSNGIAPYITYAESFEPVTGTLSPARGGAPLVPETGRLYEAGIKYQPPGYKSMITASVYELTKQNVPTTDPDNPLYSIQLGEVQSRGFEIEAALSVTDRLNVLGAFSYVDNLITKQSEVDVRAKRPPMVPTYTASLWADYTFDGPLSGIRLGGGVRYIGDTPTEDFFTGQAFTVPAVTLFDAMIGLDLGKWNRDFKGYHFALNVQNIGDEQYISSCFDTETCYVGLRRTAYGTLTYKW